MNIKEYLPAMIFLAFAILGFGTGFLGFVLSVAWAFVAVKVINHYILKKKPEDMK
jgi:predicted PurR-regulated permease PerM